MANIMDLFSQAEVANVEFNINHAKGIFERIRQAQEQVGGRPRLIAKVGSGGMKVFEFSNGNRDIVIEKFQGIIIANHKNNALFPAVENEEEKMNKPPICSSTDGITGIVRETGECRDCESCPHNVFGTAGKGKECKNMHRLYILMENCPIPVTLNIPPTSLELWRNYAIMDVAAAGLDLSEVVTEFGLTNETNDAGQKYSIVNFKMVGKVNNDVKEFCTNIGNTLESAPRMAIEGDEYNVEPTVLPQNDDFDSIPDELLPGDSDEQFPNWDEPSEVDFNEI